MKLPGYFISHQPSIAKATQEVWPLCLNGTQRLNMSRRHLFKCRRNWQPLKIIGFQDIKWLIRPQVARQVQAVEAASGPISVQEEEWPPGPGGLHGHDWRPRTGSLFPHENVRQVFNRWPGKEAGKRDFLAADVFDFIHKASRK